ncbi:MAG: diaminopimelate decarboxylase [Variovorax sp.]
MGSEALPGHPHIARKGDTLSVEGLSLTALADEFGTPLFVYSRQWMLDALAAYQRGLAGRDALICYAMKANATLGVLRVFAEAGCGFDLVSGGDLQRALAVGCDPKKIVFSGVGKTRSEMRQALQAGIACFNVESEAELDVLNAVALGLGLSAPVSLRVNPDVDPKTHPYISTGLKGNKFGIAHGRALHAYRHAATLAGLKVIGIDCHIGSQITEAAPYLDAMERLLDLVAALAAEGIALHHIDFGGGLGIDYGTPAPENEPAAPPAADSLWAQLLQQIDRRGFDHLKIVIEPGRSLVGNAGVCVSEVLYLKPGEDRNFCIIDAAMNDLPRPALYQAFHQIVPVTLGDRQGDIYDVVGPVCESGDWIGRDRSLAVQAGDRVAVLSAGAYCMSMASNYNTRGRAAEVLVSDGRAQLIRRRESLEDQLANERF